MATISYNQATEVALILPKQRAARLFQAMSNPMIAPLDTTDKLAIAQDLQPALKDAR